MGRVMSTGNATPDHQSSGTNLSMQEMMRTGNATLDAYNLPHAPMNPDDQSSGTNLSMQEMMGTGNANSTVPASVETDHANLMCSERRVPAVRGLRVAKSVICAKNELSQLADLRWCN